MRSYIDDSLCRILDILLMLEKTTSVSIVVYLFVCCSFQGLNPGLAIGEIKKMLALYNNKSAAKS